MTTQERFQNALADRRTGRLPLEYLLTGADTATNTSHGA